METRTEQPAESGLRKAKVAVVALNQHAMDFEGNKERIIRSLAEARAEGARLRVGPELEVTGYSCEDHFYEKDTETHAMEVLADILESGETEEMLSVIGLPVFHEGVRYNCDAYVLNGKIIGFRPKKYLADDGNYREPRWFTAWTKHRQTETYYLPRVLQQVTGQESVPIGDFVVATDDTVLTTEKCEEMFTPRNPGTDAALDGAEVFANGSGSHWEIRKLRTRIGLMQNITGKGGGLYMYSNFIGGDGERLLFDGGPMIVQNGKLLAQGEQFSMKDVETVMAVADFNAIRSCRGAIRSLGVQADEAEPYPRIDVKTVIGKGFRLTDDDLTLAPSKPVEPKYFSPEEEIARGPALWLWDYLRRSGASGFFLPLSGGVDSAASASIVGSMAHRVIEEVKSGNQATLADARKIVGDPSYTPEDPKEFCKRIFYSAYMESGFGSSEETKARARKLAEEIGINHLEIDITEAVVATRKETERALKRDLKFQSEGGTKQDDIALQNMQARERMKQAYALTQTLVRGKFLLVLGSANVDEANSGYYTKFDCSAADINPIGGINKMDLRGFLAYAAETFGYNTLLEILSAKPTAELQPQKEGFEAQTDEADMGMTYEELRIFGKLRKEERLGPVSMFEKLVHEWGPRSEKGLSIKEVAEKVKHFFVNYAKNRHKLTTLTPAVHAEGYSPDDNRFDLRPFLLNARWVFQFRKIDELIKCYEEAFSEEK